jgi:hypothetical protein
VLKLEDNIDYLSIKRSSGAYPDALEYTMTIKRRCLGTDLGRCERSTQNDWRKIDMPMHRLFVINKEKIKSIMTYSDAGVEKK